MIFHDDIQDSIESGPFGRCYKCTEVQFPALVTSPILDVYLENKVPFLQSSFLGSQACFCHVLDEDLAAQLQSVLCVFKGSEKNLQVREKHLLDLDEERLRGLAHQSYRLSVSSSPVSS